jgi:hypothetical protein
MLEESQKTATKRLIAAAMIAVMLSGCSQTKGWLNSAIPGAPAGDDYLAELSDLSSDDPALQAEIFADSQAAAQLAPNPSTRLRYALVLATPGHPGSDPQEAQSMLRELMTQTALMTPAEVALTTIYLKSTEELILRSSEARRLRASTDRAQRTEEGREPPAAAGSRGSGKQARGHHLDRALDSPAGPVTAVLERRPGRH